MDKIKKKASLLMTVILMFVAIASDGSMVLAAGRQLRSSTGAGSSGKNVLVAYFSRAGENYGVGNVKKGNTRIVAQMIAKQTGGELFRIETKYVNVVPTASECYIEIAGRSPIAEMESVSVQGKTVIKYPLKEELFPLKKIYIIDAKKHVRRCGNESISSQRKPA